MPEETSSDSSAAAPLGDSRADVDSSRSGLIPLPTVRGLVNLLWIFWATLLFGGTIFSLVGREPALAEWNERLLLVSHLGSSVLLVIAGWTWVLGFTRSAAVATAYLFAAGMSAGAIGDFFNAGVLQDFVRLPDPVLGGMAAFALGHLAYIAACVRVARENGFHSRARRLAGIGFWEAFGVIAWFFVVYRGTNSGAHVLVWPALPYSLLLATTAGIATYLALEDRRFSLLAAGAVLFLVSDLILAFRLFHGEFPLAPHAVWLTYGPGQMLIVYSIGTAAARRVPTR
jgi:uncharacterized membrane protein YhhN